MMSNRQKKLLLLGGSRYLLPVIREAHLLGCHVITCDYLPDNYAHRFSDEYHNVSIVDREAVLSLSRTLKIDGIMSFACDPGVVTGAYVAEQLGLPYGGSYESVSILQDKGRFRRFLTDNSFTVPVSASYTKASDALDDFSRFRLPVIVKPVDSAGSKGVRRVDNEADLPVAVANALAHSISGQFIIEEFIEAKGFASDTECFTVDGELQFVSFNNQYFDALAENPYTPAGFTWPSHMPQACQDELRSELQRLMTLLSMKNSVYNIECRQGTDGKAYLMEVSPRGGGNRLCEMLHYACGTNLIRSAVCAALGEPLDPLSDPVYDGFWAQVILHSDRDGLFKCLSIDDSVRGNVVEEALWVQPGEAIERFTGANKSLGTLVLRFDSAEEADARMSSIRDWLKIETK